MAGEHRLLPKERCGRNVSNPNAGPNNSMKYTPNNLPVFPRRAWWRYGGTTELRPTFGVDPSYRLLRVCGTGKDNIGELCTEITMVTLVDDEGVLRN